MRVPPLDTPAAVICGRDERRAPLGAKPKKITNQSSESASAVSATEKSRRRTHSAIFERILSAIHRESCANLFERVARVDWRQKMPVRAPFEQTREFIGIPKGRTKNLQLPDKDASQIGRRLIADCCAACDNSTASNETFQGCVPDRAADILYHHIDSTSPASGP